MSAHLGLPLAAWNFYSQKSSSPFITGVGNAKDQGGVGGGGGPTVVWKDKSFLKNQKHEPNIVEITHLCIMHKVHTSYFNSLLLFFLMVVNFRMWWQQPNPKKQNWNILSETPFYTKKIAKRIRQLFGFWRNVATFQFAPRSLLWFYY